MHWYKTIVLSVNILCQIFLFLGLRLTMKTNLQYFYEQKKYYLYVPFASNAVYHGSTLLLMNLYTPFLLIYLQNNPYKKKYDEFHDFAGILVLNIIQFSSYVIYAYCHTSYIDFEMYLKVVLRDHGMFNRFEKISYMITKSCWVKDNLYHDTVAEQSSSENSMDILRVILR